MWVYEDAQAALRDGLRLSRAMTFKAAVADLPLGGGKGVIMIPEGLKLTRERRHAALLDFADTVDMLGGRYIAAEDVGTSSRDMSLIATRTKHVAGLSRQRGGSGDPSPMTALGVYIAIQTACERKFGSPSVEGRTISLVGLGHVGERVARHCARDGAKLIVTDVNESKRAAAERLGARWTTPEKALEAEVDVLSPCALGGILNDESVPRLRCQVIAGAANNQLATDAIADLLAARGILWAPDFVANAGGLINIAQEFGSGGYDPGVARRRVRGIAGTLRQIFDDSGSIGATPLTAALELARKRLFAASELNDTRAA